MITVNARSTAGAGEPFKATKIDRRDVGPNDVLIDIAYSGICHTDVSRARSEFGTTMYPLVPGHEIAGIVSAVGAETTKFQVGDRVGVGCLVDSCRTCKYCTSGLEPYCVNDHVRTYNSIGRDGRPTMGGYSQQIVVDEAYVVRIPDALPLGAAAPPSWTWSRTSGPTRSGAAPTTSTPPTTGSPPATSATPSSST